MNVRAELERRLRAALASCGAPDDCPAMVGPAVRPQYGDYQVNGVMPAARRLRANARVLAERVAAAAGLSDLADRVEVAGPGFINIRLRNSWLAQELTARLRDDRLGVEPPDRRQTVVVDYSHPNLAKEMHVGHLRSTIIGDAIARTLEFLGHRVIRQNHVGDWGTQFGMLLAHMDDLAASTGARLSEALADLEVFYQAAKKRFDEDAGFADKARRYVVRLQSGDEHCRQAWQRFIAESLRHCQQVYDRLGVTLRPADIRGESAYNDDLPAVVEDLRRAGLLRQSQGAQCVFLDDYHGNEPDRALPPVIVRKTDGGYLYATTDLAGVRYRCGVLKADRILYVVDARQTLHLRQVFAVSRLAGFAPPEVSLEHHPFGTMMGPDGRPFMTRAGGAVKLMDLLDEAEQRAFELVSRKSPDLPEDQRRQIARAVGIGAVKYADLSQNRTSDYVFSWDKMLSLEGNTAPYMQYAYARISSIFRKGGQGASEEALPAGRIAPAEPPERALGVALARFPEVVETVAAECLPNLLCAYLYDLAGAFMGFYESCPVLKADEPVRSERLLLCHLTARTIRTGLDLLGIDVLSRM